MAAKSKRVLLLDDDYESMRDLMIYLQEELGWAVELTASADLLERLGREHFDLIVVDLMIRSTSMSREGQSVKNIQYDDIKWDRTGLEFLRRFRNGEYSRHGRGTPPDAPVLVLSAVADSTANGEWGKLLQREPHIEKPFRLADLVQKMRSLLGE